ncbi:MAG: hypothetical protein Q8L21_00625, partial [Candidatus Komeilibacteria bacterium]|nr:hypothetical protein [Candidatus Komeilibacteria bacterium]
MSKKQLVILVIVFAAVAIITRLIPHPWNFTPVGAFFIFSGFMLPRRALLFPLLAMLATDLVIGTYTWQIMAAVYGCYLLMALVAYSLKGRYSSLTILTTSLAGSLAFFIVTNAAVWLWSGMYQADLSGLLMSYTAGIPFFRNTLLGDLTYNAAFFGTYEVVRILMAAPAKRLNQK